MKCYVNGMKCHVIKCNSSQIVSWYCHFWFLKQQNYDKWTCIHAERYKIYYHLWLRFCQLNKIWNFGNHWHVSVPNLRKLIHKIWNIYIQNYNRWSCQHMPIMMPKNWKEFKYQECLIYLYWKPCRANYNHRIFK